MKKISKRYKKLKKNLKDLKLNNLKEILDLVFSLNALQNSIILIPRWPKAGPTGGAGLA